MNENRRDIKTVAEAYTYLAAEIIDVAASDYKAALRMRDKRGIGLGEMFFRSKTFGILSLGMVTGEQMIERLKKEARRGR